MLCKIGDAIALLLLLKSFASLSFFSFFGDDLYGHNAGRAHQDSNYVCGYYENTKDDTMIYARNWSHAEYVSLKCTSSVARQYSMASLYGQVTQKGSW